MNVRPVRPDNKDALVQLVVQFCVTLAQFRGRNPAIDLEAARAELTDYLRQDFPIFVAEDHSGKLVGYLICRTVGTVVWAESLFVSPDARRRGVGSASVVRGLENNPRKRSTWEGKFSIIGDKRNDRRCYP
jgi:L-amino acid N-acyltransferase YncA